MKAGVASTIITPPVGGWLLGPVARSTGVHDDLYAKALVLDDGNQSVAIVCLDLVGLSHAFNDELVELIRDRTDRGGGLRQGERVVTRGYRLMNREALASVPLSRGPWEGVKPQVKEFYSRAGGVRGSG